MKPAPESASIAAGFISALSASTCCVLPLAMVSIGLGGAWIAQLRALEQFHLVFIAIAVASFAFAFYRLYARPAPACSSEAEACVQPIIRRRQRVAFWVTLVAAKALILGPILYGVVSA